MKIIFIGTYPPRECGIGTFTRNKLRAMVNGNTATHEQHEGIVVAINDHENSYDYPEEVQFIIRQNEQDDYLKAARFINKSGADICILEHEFGIYGGPSGVYLLPLLRRLKIPVVAVFHTVLKTPSHNEQAILTAISRIAIRTIVMSRKAVEFLKNIYGIDAGEIEIIEHGVPDIHFDQDVSKKEIDLENKKLLLTFGLIGRNKGIETVIKALPAVVDKYPDVVYIVLGKTHPSVIRHSGEEYRNYLTQLARQLKVEDHVIFVNEFVDQKKLFKYLTATDIYVTPYLNEAQITSGTLSYAVGTGCAVISTPYWHASELLANGRGRLFDFNNDEQLSSIFMELLDQPEVMTTMRNNAYEYGREITWPKIGEKYIALVKTILQQSSWKSTVKQIIPDPLSLPSLSPDHKVVAMDWKTMASTGTRVQKVR